jgi:hypothetical protein
MQIVRILVEKHPYKWCDMAKVVAFGWNTSTLAALAYLTPYELQFGQMANLPHAMTLRYDDICPADMEPKDYPSYAVYLDQTLDCYTAAFREAKLYAMMKSQIKLSKKLKDATKCPWLQKGKLVVVFYPSTMSDDQFVVSAKLAMQWKGPFRIIEIYRNAVSLEHLDGTFFTKRSIRDLYPYNREFEELYQAADKYTRPLTNDELALSTGFEVGDGDSISRRRR